MIAGVNSCAHQQSLGGWFVRTCQTPPQPGELNKSRFRIRVCDDQSHSLAVLCALEIRHHS
jgi:hypothetical protein